MRKGRVFGVVLGVSAFVFTAMADTTLVFGFDMSDSGADLNGIEYNSTKQRITFSGAVSGTDTDFDWMDGVSGQIDFSIGAVGDLPSFSGSVTATGGAFNVGGNGGGVSGGASASYMDADESWTFVFSRDVTLTALRNWGEDSLGQTILTNDIAIAASPYTADFTAANIFVAAGDSLTFGSVDPGNYALQDFTMTVVPEPATFVLAGIGGLLVFLVRRRVMM